MSRKGDSPRKRVDRRNRPSSPIPREKKEGEKKKNQEEKKNIDDGEVQESISFWNFALSGISIPLVSFLDIMDFSGVFCGRIHVYEDYKTAKPDDIFNVMRVNKNWYLAILNNWNSSVVFSSLSTDMISLHVIRSMKRGMVFEPDLSKGHLRHILTQLSEKIQELEFVRFRTDPHPNHSPEKGSRFTIDFWNSMEEVAKEAKAKVINIRTLKLPLLGKFSYPARIIDVDSKMFPHLSTLTNYSDCFNFSNVHSITELRFERFQIKSGRNPQRYQISFIDSHVALENITKIFFSIPGPGKFESTYQSLMKLLFEFKEHKNLSNLDLYADQTRFYHPLRSGIEEVDRYREEDRIFHLLESLEVFTLKSPSVCDYSKCYGLFCELNPKVHPKREFKIIHTNIKKLELENVVMTIAISAFTSFPHLKKYSVSYDSHIIAGTDEELIELVKTGVERIGDKFTFRAGFFRFKVVSRKREGRLCIAFGREGMEFGYGRYSGVEKYTKNEGNFEKILINLVQWMLLEENTVTPPLPSSFEFVTVEMRRKSFLETILCGEIDNVIRDDNENWEICARGIEHVPSLRILRSKVFLGW